MRGRRGQGSRNRPAGKACCSLCHEWASRVGGQTSDQVKLLRVRLPILTVVSQVKKGTALVQQYLSDSSVCWSGINRESSGCSFSKFHRILGPTPLPCEAWCWMATMSALSHGSSLLCEACTPGSGSWGLWFWGSELILTPGSAMPPVLGGQAWSWTTGTVSRAIGEHECLPAWPALAQSSCGSSGHARAASHPERDRQSH